MSRQLALLGLPHAGKTAWLGRLWVSADTASGRLHKTAHPDNLQALNQLSDWLYERRWPDRSPLKNAPDFSVDLRWTGRAGAIPFRLHIADYSGEEVNAIYGDRAAWTSAWDLRAKASGLAILVRPDGEQLKPPRASRLARPAPALDDPARLFGQELMPDSDVRSEDDPAHLPTGLALVELLQLLRTARGLYLGEVPDPKALRVAVIFTAWDVMLKEDPTLSPAHFLHTRLGLLDDFLACNYDSAGIRAFGLSTTGGDIEKEPHKSAYQAGEPEEFGYVTWDSPSGVRDDPDITLPLGWLLEGDDILP